MKRRWLFCTTTLAVLAGCSDPTGLGDFGETRVFEGSGSMIGSHPSCAVLPSGVTSWWPAEGDASDLVGEHHGTPYGGLSFEPGHVQQTFGLDGQDDYVDASGAWLGAITSEITVETWARPQPPPTGGGWLFARRDPFRSEGFGIVVGGDGKLVVVVRTTADLGSVSTFASASGAVAMDEFQHIAVTASTGSGLVQAYVNGEPVSLTVTSGPATLSGSLAAITTLFVGRRQPSNTYEGVKGGGHYQGAIDELTVYSTALSADEVRAIADAGSAGKCLSSGTRFALLEVDRVQVVLSAGRSPDRFSIRGRFALGPESDGIDPVTEEVSFGLAGFTETLSGFVRDEEEQSFVFHGTPPGIRHMVIHDDGEFRIDAEDVALSDLAFSATSVPLFWLQIGDDGGAAELSLDEVEIRPGQGRRAR